MTTLADNHRLARAYIDAVTAGDLPDSLLTDDMTAWLTTEGLISKERYQQAIHLLRAMLAETIVFTVDAITAEDDRAVIEARSRGRLIDGNDYEQTYVFALRLREGRIAHIAEHYNVAVVQEKLLPLMKEKLQ
ncbi:nuclear transport factor 2 family protein [Novosphingobium sp.]|uniref:nuclear transport factor 2 family protein n=1 Tax=Novosphingobium sp. TaxID=1874826 RepID=UPI00286EB13C|nr:nuclear transport factor 2 family protein [Novosphingobium sp.]